MGLVEWVMLLFVARDIFPHQPKFGARKRVEPNGYSVIFIPKVLLVVEISMQNKYLS